MHFFSRISILVSILNKFTYITRVTSWQRRLYLLWAELTGALPHLGLFLLPHTSQKHWRPFFPCSLSSPYRNISTTPCVKRCFPAQGNYPNRDIQDTNQLDGF